MPDDLIARLNRAFAEGKSLILAPSDVTALSLALDRKRNLLTACEGLLKSTTVNGQELSMMPSCGAFADLRRAMREAK
jgi:hypothetical protein